MLAFVLLATLGQLSPDPSSLPPPLDPRLILTQQAGVVFVDDDQASSIPSNQAGGTSGGV
jgi:hypothetical protein